MDLGLSGCRALVTGASRGIGRRIAAALAEEGCSLALCARSEQDLDKVRTEFEERGATVFTQAVDVAEPQALRDFVASSASTLGGLDIVVSNASAGSVKGDDAWVTSTRGDLQAFAVLADAARADLVKSDRASVVAISSTSALDVDFPSGPASFGAIKAAVLQHASALARSFAPDGVRVNSVSPGPIEFEGGAWAGVKQSRPAVFDQMVSSVPWGRLGTPEEVADAVTFLASPRASFCTGANLVVDGGLLSRVQH